MFMVAGATGTSKKSYNRYFTQPKKTIKWADVVVIRKGSIGDSVADYLPEEKSGI